MKREAIQNQWGHAEAARIKILEIKVIQSQTILKPELNNVHILRKKRGRLGSRYDTKLIATSVSAGPLNSNYQRQVEAAGMGISAPTFRSPGVNLNGKQIKLNYIEQL